MQFASLQGQDCRVFSMLRSLHKLDDTIRLQAALPRSSFDRNPLVRSSWRF